MSPPSSFCTLKACRSIYSARQGARAEVCLCCWFLQRHEKPCGISWYERASNSDTQLNKGPAGLRATMPGAILTWCPRGLMSMRASLKTPRFGVSDRRVKMVTMSSLHELVQQEPPAHPGKGDSWGSPTPGEHSSPKL